LPTGADDSNSQYNDGRVGTAYIQELRFNKYCERLQNLIVDEFNTEFKRYLLEKGINIDTSMFDLQLQQPMNFASYRQAELDNQRIGTFTQLSAVPEISKRYALSRFLGLSAEEMAENERLWREENDETLGARPTESTGELRSAGISGANIDADLGAVDQEADTEETPTGDQSPVGTSTPTPDQTGGGGETPPTT